jgi:TonB family protein
MVKLAALLRGPFNTRHVEVSTLRELVIIVSLFLPALTVADDTEALVVGPTVFRAHAESVILPDYPLSSYKANHTGVAVVEVTVSATGKVTQTKVLESPDKPIADAVEAAVKRWSFHPLLVAGKPEVMKSRLIFYFRVVDHKSSVVDAIAENPVRDERARPTPIPRQSANR